MHVPSLRPTVRTIAVVAAITLGGALLVGCTSTSSTTGPSSTSSASSRATSGSAPKLVSTPFDVACSTLVPTTAIDAAAPGMTPTTSVVRAAGSDLSVIASEKGTLCGWKDAEGDTITVGVAQLNEPSLTRLKNALVTTSNSVPTYGVEGYFQYRKKNGIAEAFSDPYWIVASSSTFVEPGSAQPVVAAAVESLTSAS